MVARFSRTRTSMAASGHSASTSGRSPRASRRRSHTASFTLSAVKRVLRSSSFMPWADTAMLAPGAITSSQGSSSASSNSRSARRASTRPTTSMMREASRDHRHAASAWRTSQKKATPPPSGRTLLMPKAFSSSASGASSPARQLAKNSSFSCCIAQSPQPRRTCGRFARSANRSSQVRMPNRAGWRSKSARRALVPRIDGMGKAKRTSVRESSPSRQGGVPGPFAASASFRRPSGRRNLSLPDNLSACSSGWGGAATRASCARSGGCARA